jgi:hypothetical protein
MARSSSFRIIACAWGAAATLACSSGGGASAATLSGVYVATRPGPIVAMTFAGYAYTLVTSQCGGGISQCQHDGTFAVQTDPEALALTDAASGETSTFALSVILSREQAGGPAAACGGNCALTIAVGDQVFTLSADAPR